MKVLLCSFLFLLGIINSWADETNIYKITSAKINLNLIPSPIFYLQNIQYAVSSGQRWLHITLEFVPRLKSQTYLRRDFDLNDNSKIKFEAVISGSDKKTYILTREVAYWPIMFDGKRHYALTLVPPQILDKIANRVNNVFLRESVKILVVFYHNGKTINKFTYPSRTNPKFFKDIKNSPNAIILKNAILTRNQSPWICINFDKYELIKQ